MMTRTNILISAALVVLLTWASWMFRYEALNPTDGRPGFPPILDRWSGEVLFMGEWWPVHDIKAKEAEIEARGQAHGRGFRPIERQP